MNSLNNKIKYNIGDLIYCKDDKRVYLVLAEQDKFNLYYSCFIYKSKAEEVNCNFSRIHLDRNWKLFNTKK